MMSIYKFLQSQDSVFLDKFCEIFAFFTKPIFLLLSFAIFYFFVRKKTSFKLLTSFMLIFFLGDIALKNLFMVTRPYDLDPSLLGIRGLLPESSFPSTSMMFLSSLCTFIFIEFFRKNRNLSNNNKSRCWIISSYVLVVFCLIIFLTIVGFAKIYHAESSIFDVICGVVFGIIVGIITFSFVSIDCDVRSFLLLVFPLIILFLYLPEWTMVSTHIRSFQLSGIFASVILGMFFEKKYISYAVRDNILTFAIKSFIAVIVFIAMYFTSTILPALSIVHFAVFFIYGITICLLLPCMFKVVDRYAYVFDANVDKDKVLFSSISFSPKNTEKLAKKLDKFIQKGDIVILSGDLGAGKSEIVRGYLRYCNINGKITSPTFTLVNVYENDMYHFYHFDMYRLEDEDEARNIGFEEMLSDDSAIKFIEWAERVPHFIPKHFKKITIIKLGQNVRNIVLEEI